MRWFRRKPRPTYTPPEMVTVTLAGGPMDGRHVEVPVGSRELRVPYLLNVAALDTPESPRLGYHVYRQAPVFEFVKEGGEGVDG